MNEGSRPFTPTSPPVVLTPATQPPVKPHLSEGLDVTVDSKSPFYSTTLWGVLITVLFGWLSKHSWWTFDKDTTVKVLEELIGYGVGPALTVYGRWTATRPLGVLAARKAVTIASLLICFMLAGCGVSKSYVVAVDTTYPVVAARLDSYGKSAEATKLRASTQPSVSFDATYGAWSAVAPAYRAAVSSDAALTAHRKTDWLTTADLLDQLQVQELKHQNVFLFAPAPTTLPSK